MCYEGWTSGLVTVMLETTDYRATQVEAGVFPVIRAELDTFSSTLYGTSQTSQSAMSTFWRQVSEGISLQIGW